MNNKNAGTRFEREFAEILAKNWFWVHLFQDNRNGQPCDVVAAKGGSTWLFDCKDCQGNKFQLSRVEENQYNAMKLFHMTGNSRGMFAIRFPGCRVYLVDFEVLDGLKKDGIKGISQEEIVAYGRELDGWINEVLCTEPWEESYDEGSDWV